MKKYLQFIKENNDQFSEEFRKNLFYTIAFGSVETLKQNYIDTFFFDVESKSTGESTPLCYAAACGRIDMVEFLLSIGANPNASGARGETPLMKSIFHMKSSNDADRSLEIIKILEKYKVNVNQKNNKGETAIFYAVDVNSVMLLRYLIKMKASIFVENGDGYNIYDYAKIYGHHKMELWIKDNCPKLFSAKKFGL